MDLTQIPFKNFDMAPQMPIIDELSYKNSEVEELLLCLPTISQIGRSALRNNLTSSTSLAAVHSKQDTIDFLVANTEVREQTQEALSGFAANETHLQEYLTGKYDIYEARMIYRKSRVGLSKTLEILSDVPSPNELPIHLENVLDKLKQLDSSESGDLLRGKVYLTAAGVKGPGSNWRHTPRLGFSGYPFTGRAAATFGIGLYGTKHGVIPEAASMGVAMMAMYGMMNVPFPVIHVPAFMLPVRQKLLKNTELATGLQGLAELDSLQALAQATIDSHQPTVRPVFTDESAGGHHIFEAIGLSNPLLALQDNRRDVVRNDVVFDNERLTFLTGPNSGGKSTISKAIVYNQLLAHAGSHVFANAARISLADKVVYHIPSAPDLGADVGRFEHELGIVKPHFQTATPNSLVVLDDCLDGTTHEERVAQLKNLMLGFLAVGSTTIFSTHAHELAEMFESKALGQFIQVEFDAATERPTYRIKPGVSHTSHANNVAQRLGLDEEGIAISLHERGIPAVSWT